MILSTKPKIAILGATGYIGRSLYPEILATGEYEVFLFSREKQKLAQTIHTYRINSVSEPNLRAMKDFGNESFDVIINATGVGDSALQREDPSSVFALTEQIDNSIISYLKDNPKTLYLNLSSGAVFGSGFTEAITSETLSKININQLKASEYYSVAKLNAEAKHRALSNLKIVDLRVFAFFSQYVDTKTEFLMSELVTCLKDKQVFKTSSVDITRDYITPTDLWSLIEKVMHAENVINDVYDVYSQGTVTKFELLAFLNKNYGLEYQLAEAEGIKTGFSKNVYFSENRKAESLDYTPAFSSLTGITQELEKMKQSNLF